MPPQLAESAAWLGRLRDEQLRTASEVAVPHDFRFTDRILESRITA
jgi:hypothetical protein